MKTIANETLLRHLVTILPKQSLEEKQVLLQSFNPTLGIELTPDKLHMKNEEEVPISLDEIERIFICNDCLYIQMKDLTMYLLKTDLHTGQSEFLYITPRPNPLQRAILKLQEIVGNY